MLLGFNEQKHFYGKYITCQGPLKLAMGFNRLTMNNCAGEIFKKAIFQQSCNPFFVQHLGVAFFTTAGKFLISE